MPGPGSRPGQALVPGMHVLKSAKTSMAGTSPDEPGHDDSNTHILPSNARMSTITRMSPRMPPGP